VVSVMRFIYVCTDLVMCFFHPRGCVGSSLRCTHNGFVHSY